MGLEGKVALITGGGTGIGTAIAKRFVSEGAKICITGRRKEMLEQVALDYGPSMIRCNVVCPGGVRTAMLENSLSGLAEPTGTDTEGVFKIASSMVPLRRFAKPDEITGICVYLASDESSFMTGSVLLVDGGAAVVDISGAAITNAGVNWGV